MAAKDKVLNKYNEDALLRATGGQMKGAGFRKAKRAANKQSRINKRAQRKASRKGEQIKGGMYGYKAAEAESQKVGSYFDDLKTKRKQNATKAGVIAAGVAITGGALAAGMAGAAGAAGAGAAGTTAAGTTAAGTAAGTTAAVGGGAAAAGAGTTAAATGGATAAGTAATAAGTTGVTTGVQALTNAQKAAKALKTADKVLKVGKQAKDLLTTSEAPESAEMTANRNTFNPLAGPIARGYAASPTEAELYGTAYAPQPELQSYTEIASPYGMGMITDPRGFMAQAEAMQEMNSGQGQSGLANIYKTGGRVKFKNSKKK